LKIYLASSWRNVQQPAAVELLRSAGHEVYDFRNPAPGDRGFSWSDIDPDWQLWEWGDFRSGACLGHEIAAQAFARDCRALEAADLCVLLLPCGRSAHLEAGFAVGRGIPLLVTVHRAESVAACVEPELMYRWAKGHPYLDELVGAVALLEQEEAARRRGPLPKVRRREILERLEDLERRASELEGWRANASYALEGFRVARDNLERRADAMEQAWNCFRRRAEDLIGAIDARQIAPALCARLVSLFYEGDGR